MGGRELLGREGGGDAPMRQLGGQGEDRSPSDARVDQFPGG